LPSSTGSSGRGGTRLQNDDKYDFKQVGLSYYYYHKTFVVLLVSNYEFKAYIIHKD